MAVADDPGDIPSPWPVRVLSDDVTTSSSSAWRSASQGSGGAPGDRRGAAAIVRSTRRSGTSHMSATVT